MKADEFAEGSPDSPESNSANHREEQQAKCPDFGDYLFDIDPRPCIPIFLPAHLFKPTGEIPASRMPSLPSDPRMFVRTSLREALQWCTNVSDHPISFSSVEETMWRHGLAECDVFIQPVTHRYSGLRVFDGEKRARQITKVSAELTGVAYEPAVDEHPGEIFIRLPSRFVHEGKTKDLADVLDWACQTWGLLGTEREGEYLTYIARARGVHYPVRQFRDGTFDVPRLSLPVWCGICSLILPKPPLADLPF